MLLCKLVRPFYTRISFLHCAVSIVLTLGALVGVQPIVAQAPQLDRWGQLYVSNDLEGEGKPPFHLAIGFQLYDMSGKPSHTGSVDVWWNGPHDMHTEIHSPNYVQGSDGAKSKGFSDAREGYLVDQLLEMSLRPITRRIQSGADTPDIQKRAFGKASLDCLVFKPKNPSFACVEPNTDDLRVLSRFDGDQVVLRNTVGKFLGTFVALNLQISYMGRNAISGKVTTLQSIDPAKAPTDKVPLSPSVAADPSPAPVTDSTALIPGGVIAGKRISFVVPDYPMMAKQQHLSGSVLLSAVIGKDGSIQKLVPIASTDPMFTDAAVDAVRKWKYSQYFLNGVPTEVDTTITVNFALNAR